MQKRITYTLLILIIALDLFAQKNISAELLKVRQVYLSTESFSANVTVTGYATKNDKTGSVLGQGLLRKAKNAYYSKFGTDEMISNSHCTVIIDHEDKKIIYMDASKDFRTNQQQVAPNLDSLLSLNDTVIYGGIQNGMKVFSFYNSNSPMYRTELFVDATTLFIKRLIYYYPEESEENGYDMDHVVIDYNNISLKISDNTIFSEKKYIASTGGKPRVNEAYKQYKLTIVDGEKP